MNHYYTDEINTLILISLLKQHCIKRVIVSPGTTNISFVASIQRDPFFVMYSAVDERAAAFMACGLAEECGETVVLSCTGATASRNYIPGLTEAYYRKLPVLAVTSSQHEGRIGNYVAQSIDRSQPFKDLVKKSYHLRELHTDEDCQRAITEVNEALLELNHGTQGPVHINLYTNYSNNFTVKELPKCRKISRLLPGDTLPQIPNGKIGIFIGAHGVFSEEETSEIETFCSCNNAVVICDQVSNYRGKHRFLANLVNSQEYDFGTKFFDLIIYIGSVHGAYLNFSGKELWRVNPDGIIRDPYCNCTAVFEMKEVDFFSAYCTGGKRDDLIAVCNEADKMVRDRIPELPFSNLWIAKKTSCEIPSGSVLHLAILNSLRAWNYFETNSLVQVYSNTGGYGIDGCMSSCIGSSLALSETRHYLIIGDLAFFYDVNSIVSIFPNNLHIMLINNGVGTEFKNYNHRASIVLGDDADCFVAAKGHNGHQNKMLIKNLAKSLGYKYMSASSKEEFEIAQREWLNYEGAVLFEVFTNDKDESLALEIINSVVKDTSIKARLKRTRLYRIVKSVLKR